MRISGGRMAFEPRHHRRTGGQRFPAAAKSAGALRAGGIDYVMSDFRMSAVNAAVEFAVEHHAAADAGADGHIDQAGAIAAGAPSGLGEGGGVAVVFEGDADVENLRQIVDGIFSAPAGKKIDVAEFAADGIDRAGGSDADAGEFRARLLRGFTQHVRDRVDAFGVTIGVGGGLCAGEHFASVVDDADCDFCSSDIDCADHRSLHS